LTTTATSPFEESAAAGASNTSPSSHNSEKQHPEQIVERRTIQP